jgi:hypothetical protein
MFGDVRSKALSAEAGMDPYVRLMFACFAKANVYGHCPFEDREMKRVLARDDGTPAHRNVVRSALNKLIRLGIAAPGSTTRCVVLDASLYQRGDNRHWSCSEPSHADRLDYRWVHGLGGWVHGDDWDDWLQRPEGREMVSAALKGAPEIVHPCT